jgi:CRISPR-associated endonuclease/helicase Cas3
VDISADHMVCDLTTFESMAQRFGRVNRYGLRDDTRIDVVYPAEFDEKHPLTSAWQATLSLLDRLRGDASPLSLRSLDRAECEKAFAPAPDIPHATDILFDAWALTSIRGSMPGRPPVEPYLHGIAEWAPPETYVAWRKEVELITDDLLVEHPPDELLDEYPLKPHELLRDRSDRIYKYLQTLAERYSDAPVWLVDERGEVDPLELADLAKRQRKDDINNRTVLLPPGIGNLTSGILGDSGDPAEDVADVLEGPDQRLRIFSDDPEYDAKTAKMRCVRGIELPSNEDSDEPPTWDWFERIPEGGGRPANCDVPWQSHVDKVIDNAERIVQRLNLPDAVRQAVVLAARLHDHGKRCETFQIALGNPDFPHTVLAKSRRRAAVRIGEPYRHEFSSVLEAQDAQAHPEFHELSDDLRDLALHLIAAHHGRARPHFSIEEAVCPGRASEAQELAIETPRRFARLQRKYGRWGLAYLESLLRAADWAASAAEMEAAS